MPLRNNNYTDFSEQSCVNRVVESQVVIVGAVHVVVLSMDALGGVLVTGTSQHTQNNELEENATVE